jgi:hypothetical protein
MSNTDSNTSTTSNCKDCDVELTNSYSLRCDKCYNRSDNSDVTHELALAENTLRRTEHNVDELWHGYAYNYMRRRDLERDVKADDSRVEELLKEMYDVMVNNSSAHLWQNFVDEIEGMPNLNRRTYSGSVTLKYYFDNVEIAGDIADWEIEDAILDALSGDFSYGDEHEREVEYEED